MSLTKSITRLSLLAGSSIAAAGLSAGVLLAPGTALAQATCAATTSPVIGANGTNAATLPAGTYNPGLVCNYVGDTATVTTSGAITVSSSGGVPADPLVNGVNLRATGTSDIRWTSTNGTVTGGNQTNGPVIDARTVGGDIILSTAGVTGSAATITHGIFAESTGGGNVSVTTSASVSGSNATTGNAAIEARSTGGSGDVNVTLTAGGASGRLYGIRAEAAGAGDLTINMQGTSTASGATSLVYAKTGSGLLRIDATNLGGGSPTSTGSALRIETGGDAILNFGALSMRGSGAIVDMTTTAGTQTTLTHTDGIGALFGNGGNNLRSESISSLVVRAAGGGNITINSGGVIGGRVDLSAHSGALNWNIDGTWFLRDASSFGAGNATITFGPDAIWATAIQSLNAGFAGTPDALETTSVSFGDGDDRIVNQGLMVVGAKMSNSFSRYSNLDYIEATTNITGLESFENSGSVYFGSVSLPGDEFAPGVQPLREGSYAVEPDYMETDYAPDDVLLMPGADWIGSGDSLLVMDVLLAANQPACDVALRATSTTTTGDGSTLLSGDMPAADCLGLQGGSTAGETRVLLNQLGGGDRGGPLRIVLVDVAGGESAAGHFVLDPRNHGFIDNEEGGYIDVGFFIVPLVYDAEAQQHILLGTAGPNAWQTATWATAAHELWRTTTGSWFDRQADLRGDLPDGVGGGMWLRTSGDVAKRDVVQLQQSGTTTFTWDNSYEQQTYAVTGGLDLMVGGGADSVFVVGVMAGYANSKIEYDPSPNTAQLDSWNGGLYASFLSGGLYVDAALSANKADIEADIVDLGLFPAGTVLSTPFLSLGVQVEGGYRFPISGGLFVEPLAGVSWVRTEWDTMTVPSDDPLRPGVDLDFGDPVSLRANVGARVGMDQDLGVVRAQYSLLGRVWNEAEGEAELTLDNVVDDVFVGDELTGTMSELGLGASIYGSVVSGFLNVGGKWADDYENVGGSVGVRVAW